MNFKNIKNKFFWLLILLINVSGQVGFSQVADHFQNVDQVIWVVKDVESVKDHWQKLGFHQFENYGEVRISNSKTGRHEKVSMLKANLGGLQVTWIAPQGRGNVFGKFLSSYGEGIMSIVHRLDNSSEMKKERARLAGKGVEVLDKVIFETPKGKLPYFLMDTRTKGMYVLGYIYGNADKEVFRNMSPENKYDLEFSQYAFAIGSVEPASSYWEKLGLPAFRVTQGSVREKEYHGKPADYALKQGWQNHAGITYEWCIPLQSPTVYEDHMEAHGEGFHHLGFNAENYDKVLELYESLGYEISMSGAWGEKGEPGSGRFAYVDLEKAGGVAMELLWHYSE